MKCRICGNIDNNQIYTIKEMMFGTREEFTYFECGFCGCLQISEQPKDMSEYYPSAYYEPEKKAAEKGKKKGKKFLALKLILKVRKLLGERTALKAVTRLYNSSEMLRSIAATSILFSSKILEIGCGEGVLMSTLKSWGFDNVVGADLYACGKADKSLQIVKTTVEAFSQQFFDMIIFDHSLEHMPDQLGTLVKVSDILSDEGTCLARIPVKTEYIWKRYGVNWVQIDAPRHFFIHTQKSFKILAEKAGFQITNIAFDSTAFQFWGSEQYLQNIPLRASNSYSVSQVKSIFMQEQIQEFSEMAKQLNKDCQGDQATFHLRKKNK